MPALSYFSVITWIAPKSVVVANLVCVDLISSSIGQSSDADTSSLEFHLVSECFQ